MKNNLLFLLLILSPSLFAQYYYNDIIGAQENSRLMKSYRDNKVRTMSATGFDANNVKSSDFLEFHEVKDNGNTLKITSRTQASHTVSYLQFDAQHRLVAVRDSSAAQVNRITYTYDSNGWITLIENAISDSANDFNQTEKHIWTYDNKGNPVRMWRVITGTDNPKPDSLEVRFVAEESGKPGDEKTYRRGVEASSLFYYYDDKGRLTDIVRFNKKLNKLLPDVMFEYDDADRVIQKITTTSSREVGYMIWRFLFDSRGLKTKEALFDNYKQLTGKIEYTYSFGQ